MTTRTHTTAVRRRRSLALTAAPLVLVATLAACSGADGLTSDDAGSAGGAAAEDAAPRADAGGSTGGPGGGEEVEESTSARVLPGDRDIVYRGRVSVRVRDVAVASRRVEDLTSSAGGVVFSQQTSGAAGPDGYAEATMTLRVPPAEFAPALDAIAALGRELSRSRTAEDVTTQLADTSSRVRSQERSVERVRALLDEAATIGEVVQVEAELARREADLESLQAQLARLQDVTEMATIDVTLVQRDQRTGPEPDDALGFLSGLRGGWHALVGVLLVALTAVGAVLPFAVLLAALGLPAYAVLRRRRTPAATPTP